MRRHAFLAVGALLLTSVALGAPPGPPVVREVTLTALSAACPGGATGTCYGYNGTVPGSVIDINVGDEVQLTLVNRLPEAVSFHVHGMVLGVASDGLPPHAGANFPDSSVAPGASFTYTFKAAYAGLWHYHDHAMGADGAAGVRAGLFGTIVVRSGGDARPATVVDLHLLDPAAPASAKRLVAHASAGAPFELDATALGNDIWTLDATDPAGAALAPQVTLGPALSHGYLVGAAAPGTYTWTARAAYSGALVTAEVIVP